MIQILFFKENLYIPMKLNLFLFFFISHLSFAQNLKVTGKVVDGNTDEGLPSVSIKLKGSSTGTISSISGEFSIDVPKKSNQVLIFTLIGYKLQEVNIGNKAIINVELQEDTQLLNEVVAIGYGNSINRRDLTSSISSVGAKQLKDIPLTNAAEALTGRLAGVRVTTSDGAPGADIQIRVRGGGSITQDNSPIYVVDGIQVENAIISFSSGY